MPLVHIYIYMYVCMYMHIHISQYSSMCNIYIHIKLTKDIYIYLSLSLSIWPNHPVWPLLLQKFPGAAMEPWTAVAYHLAHWGRGLGFRVFRV